MAPYEALYGRRCRSPIGWFQPGEARFFGTDFIRDYLEKVKLIYESLHTTRSRKKSYADRKVRDVVFMDGEKVLLRVSHMKGVIRFGKKENLSPWYIGPCNHIGFQFSAFEGESGLCRRAGSHDLRILISKYIASMKVQWRGQPIKVVTWETEHEMRSRYPHLSDIPSMILNPFDDERLCIKALFPFLMLPIQAHTLEPGKTYKS
ncbi:uncharacterized protein [Nicotiana tomentosiformis]|uniref:uncharacterized protein n=1 Tax=Nicotiana tomentosiformis TaxID=4098 RepID=UPI00388CEA1B